MRVPRFRSGYFLVFHRDVRPIPTQQTTSAANSYGNARKQSTYTQDKPDHKRVMRHRILKVHRSRPVQEIGSAGKSLE